MQVSFAEEDEAVAAIAYAAAGCVMHVLDPDQTETDTLIDVLERHSPDGSAGAALQRAALDDRSIPGEMGRAFLVLCGRMWSSGGRTSLLNLVDLPRLDGGTVDTEVVRAGYHALHHLAAAPEPALQLLFQGAPDDLARLAGLLGDKPSVAAELLLFAAQLESEPETAAGYAADGGRLAAAAGEARMLAAASCLRVRALCGLGPTPGDRRRHPDLTDAPSRLEVFDAMDAALRHVTDPAADAADMLPVLAQARAQAPYLAPLDRFFDCAVAEDEDERLPALVAWDIDTERLPDAVSSLPAAAVEAERGRDALVPVRRTEAIHADWATWSFDHPSYQRAVPHNTSLLRQRNLDIVQLELQHESQHVLSMIGGVGTAVLALRAAALELELDLWAQSGEVTDETTAAAAVERAAPLARANLSSLALAEQAGEILAKMQVLQSVWNPWFEGIAVFGELTDGSGDEVSNSMSEILVHLVDVPQTGPTVPERIATIRQAVTEAEARYTAALRSSGASRLRGYLDVTGPKYVAGYLTVRAVVSRWRRTSGGSLPASRALRLLLHLTRFGTLDDGVPDLSLPLGEFAAAAEETMLRWVGRIAALDEKTISFASTATEGFSWRNLQVAGRGDTYEEAAARAPEVFDGLVRQALRSLTGPQAPVDRVPGADETCAEVLGVAAQRIADRDPELHLALTLLNTASGQASLLPIGRTSARFWLSRRSRHVVFLVRTTEERADNGQPSYDLMAMPLGAEEFAGLVRAVAENPYERLTIARFADLAPRNLDAGRGYGRNVLGFKLGTWTHAQPRGLMTGADSVSPSLEAAVRDRLDAPPALRMEALLHEPRTGAAARTAEWTEDAQAWADEHGLPIAPWVRRVHELAVSVRDASHRDAERRASLRLLTAVVGDAALAGQLSAQGPVALAPYDPHTRELVHEALYASGSDPVPTGAFEDVPDGHPLLRVLDIRDGCADVRPYPLQEV